MAELLAATPHATHPVLRSGAQKAPSWGRASTRALDAEHGADEASGTARRPSPGGPGEPPPQGARRGAPALRSSLLPSPPAGAPPPETPSPAPLKLPSSRSRRPRASVPPVPRPCPRAALFLPFLSLATGAARVHFLARTLDPHT